MCVRCSLWIAAVLLFAVAVAAASVQAAPNEAYVKELAPGVYFRKAQTEPVFTGCNQGWVVFKDFVLVIEASFPGTYGTLIDEVRKTTDKPIRFVFDTHHHGDHADGNVHFVRGGATAVASERSKPLFLTKGLQGFEGAKKEKPDEYGNLKYETPALYFSQKLVIEDETQRVELLFFGHGHTPGDAVAWLPQHGILFTGDACVNGAFNYTGESDTASWISVLNQLEELPIKHLCPGHGELSDKGLLAQQRRYFVELRETIGRLIADGKKLNAILEEIDLPFYKEWAGVEVKTRDENIRHVYMELSPAAKAAGG